MKVAQPMPRSLPRFLASRRRAGEAFPVRALQHLGQQRRRVAAVIGRAGRRLVRECALAQHVAPPQLDAVDAGDARGLVDQPLHQV